MIALEAFIEKLGKALYIPLDGFVEFFNGKLMVGKTLEALDLTQIHKCLMIWCTYMYLEASYNFKLTSLSPEIAAGYYKNGEMPPEEPEKAEIDGNAPIEAQDEIEEEIIAPASP